MRDDAGGEGHSRGCQDERGPMTPQSLTPACAVQSRSLRRSHPTGSILTGGTPQYFGYFPTRR
jgi:hypothetical protein